MKGRVREVIAEEIPDQEDDFLFEQYEAARKSAEAATASYERQHQGGRHGASVRVAATPGRGTEGGGMIPDLLIDQAVFLFIGKYRPLPASLWEIQRTDGISGGINQG